MLVPAQLVQHGQRVLVQREVLVALPLAHHVRRTRPCPGRVTAHPQDDLLGEGDPDLLVVHELVVALQRLDRSRTRLVVAIRVEHEAVALADSAVSLGPELRPGSKQREVDIEENCSKHRSRIALAPAASRYPFRAPGCGAAW